MRNMLTFVLKAAVSSVLLYFAFSRVNFNFISQRLDSLDYVWLSAAVLIFIGQTMVGALRWQKIVHHCEAPGNPLFALSGAFRYTFIAAFFNQTLPSTVGGDAVRVWLLGRNQGGWQAATFSVLIDRMVGVLVLAILVVFCLPWSFALISDVTGRIALLVVGFGSIGACLVFLAFGFLRWRLFERWWLTRQLAAAGSTACRVLGSPSSGPLIIAYSLLNHLMLITAAWCLAKSVAAPLEWSQALLLVLPVMLIASIPLSIAGWGTRETAMVLAFGYAGLPEGDGLIVSVLMGIAAFAAGLLGGAVWILDRGKRQVQPPP
jgi:glycosyltransferase 2 family protein